MSTTASKTSRQRANVTLTQGWLARHLIFTDLFLTAPCRREFKGVCVAALQNRLLLLVYLQVLLLLEHGLNRSRSDFSERIVL